jgi:hypothetical protein
VQLVNRAAITVRPKQPYVDWANALDHDGPRMSPERLRERSVYLIEDLSEYLVDEESVIKRYFKEIFAHELRAWHRIEDDWPKKRGFVTFMDWFEVEVHSMVLDIDRSRIDTEPYED